MPDAIYYLGYGSNLSYRRIVARIGWCEIVGVAAIDGWCLGFNKRGTDGSAKCNALDTGIAEHRLMGIVYRIDATQKRQLDHYEGVGFGYKTHVMTARLQQRTLDVLLYIATPDHIDSGLAPYSWYRDFVLSGAVEHGLPRQYTDAIAAVVVQPDPDADRDAGNRQILDTPIEELAVRTSTAVA